MSFFIGHKVSVCIIILILLFCMSCTSEGIYEDIVPVCQVPNQTPKGNSFSYDSIGRVNAVKKAYQMVDLEFVPLLSIEHNTGTFSQGEKHKGLIYSSVKEIETYVGNNVSFHTFMTAVNNPRSVLYTEQINKAPYHGVNCKAYYGTVCSGLVCYALGLNRPRLNSFDFPESPLMQELDSIIPENLCLADILWRKGHVALVTDLVRDDNGMITTIEYCEAIGSCCKKRHVSRIKFLESTMKNFTKVFRYKQIASNTDYIPVNEFVAVSDEALVPFVYNEALCVNKGDKSCYFEGERVVINILCDEASKVEIYKDNILYDSFPVEPHSDIPLVNLPYGDYKARVLHNDAIIDSIKPVYMGKMTRGSQGQTQYSKFTCWKVVNGEVNLSKGSRRIYFSSVNAIPDQIICCTINGTRPPLSKGFYHIITDEDIQKGYVDVDYSKMTSEYPYIQVLFSTEFGNIIHKPINWYE